MLLAALSLWTAIPLGWLYIGSKVSHTQFPAEGPYAVVAVGIVVSILLVAWLIGRLNRLYMRITGTNRLAPMRPTWLKSMRDTSPRRRHHDRGRGGADGLGPARRRSSFSRLVLPPRRLADRRTSSSAQTTNLPSSCITVAVDFELAAEAQVADQVGVDGGLVDAAGLRVATCRPPCGRCRRSSRRAGPRGCRGRSRSWCRSRARRGGGRPRRCRAARSGTPRRARRWRRRPCRPRSAGARPATSRPPITAGRWKVTSPSTESSTGPVKNSPSGMLWSPSQGMNVRPAMPSLMSVPGAVTRTSSWPSIHSASRSRLGRGALPGGQRVGVVGEAGAEVEVLVVGEAHLRLRGVGVGREERVAPAELALGAALHHPVQQLAGRGLAARLALRRDRRRARACWRWRRRRSARRRCRRSTRSAARSTRAARRWRACSRPPPGRRATTLRIGCAPAFSTSS